MRIYLIVSRDDDKLDASDQCLVQALVACEFEVLIKCWEDVPVDSISPDSFVLFRSIVSSYSNHDKFREFVFELKQIGVFVANDLRTLEWNFDKAHLTNFHGPGFFSPKTIVAEPSTIFAAIKELKDDYCVIKPRFGGSGEGVIRLRSSEAATLLTSNFLRSDCYRMGVLVQEYIKEIENGEYSFVFVDGKISHTVLKRSTQGDFRLSTRHGEVSVEIVDAADNWVGNATNLCRSVPGLPAFVRADCAIVGEKLCCMEAETIDPNLYFDLNRPGATLLAANLRKSFLHRLSSCQSSGA